MLLDVAIADFKMSFALIIYAWLPQTASSFSFIYHAIASSATIYLSTITEWLWVPHAAIVGVIFFSPMKLPRRSFLSNSEVLPMYTAPGGTVKIHTLGRHFSSHRPVSSYDGFTLPLYASLRFLSHQPHYTAAAVIDIRLASPRQARYIVSFHESVSQRAFRAWWLRPWLDTCTKKKHTVTPSTLHTLSPEFLDK